MFGPKRGHFLAIFDDFIKNFGILLVIIVVAILKDPKILIDKFEYVFLGLINPIYRFFVYLSTLIEINESSLIIKKGIFVKKTIEIPLNTITTVDLSQDLMYQICDVYKIKVDNSSQIKDVEQKAEASFALKKQEALYVKRLLLKKSNSENLTNQEKMPKESVVATVSDFFMLGVLQSKFLYLISLLPIIVTAGVASKNILKSQVSMENIFLLLEKKVGIFRTLGIFFLLLFILAFIISIISSILTYYNFRLTKTRKAILVEYGLLTKKQYSLAYEKISGVRLHQSLLMRLLKLYKVEVLVIGYGDESEKDQKEETMLFPIANKEKVEQLFSKLLPQYRLPEEYEKPSKNAFVYFFITGYFIASLALILLSFVFRNRWVTNGATLLFLLAVIKTILEYKSTALNIGEKIITFCNGGFSKKITLIPKSRTESVTFVTTIPKRKKGICHIKLGFFAPIMVSRIMVKNLNIQVANDLKEQIEATN